MDESEFKEIAAQLRRPQGYYGKNVGELMNEGNKLINQHALSKLDLKPNQAILEIGMGNGHFVSEIMDAADGITYVGCDYSDLMVEEANRINDEYIQSGDAEFVYTDAENLPLESAQFDTCLTVNTVYFWDRPEKIASELHRVLKTGGRLIIGFRSPEVMKLYPMTKYNFGFWTEEKLSSLLEDQGFVVESISRESEPPAKDLEGNFIEAANTVLIAKKQ